MVAQAFVHNPRPDIFDVVDHIDHNPENNCAANLRWLNTQLNSYSRRSRGVSWNTNKWMVRLNASGIRGAYYGRFTDYDEALAFANKCKKDRFEKAYAEALKSEPPFKSVGTQCTLLE